MDRIRTTNDFIKRALEVHGDIYDYSLVNYENSKKKIKIRCLKHNIFEQLPNNHLNGKGCKMCNHERASDEKKKGRDQFIKEAIQVHGDKYDYSLVEYKNGKTKVKIICEKHDVFKQRPISHLNGHGCSKCRYDFFSENYKKEWLDSEINWLIKNCRKYPASYCAKKLNIDTKTLRKKSVELKLNFFTKQDPYKFHHTIQRYQWRNAINGAKSRNIEFSISPDYVWGLYLTQDKKCALSGVDIFFGKRHETTASIDRIDSNKGYICGNIQIIHKILNRIKINTPNNEFIMWCKSVANFNK